MALQAPNSALPERIEDSGTLKEDASSTGIKSSKVPLRGKKMQHKGTGSPSKDVFGAVVNNGATNKSDSSMMSVQINHSSHAKRPQSPSQLSKASNNDKASPSKTSSKPSPSKYSMQKSPNQDYERKKKAFLRQVYTNMQNKESGKKRLYDKYSKKYANELNNTYMPRTKEDNEWQYRLMNSKLQTFESSAEDQIADFGAVHVSTQRGNNTLQSNEFNLASFDNSTLTARQSTKPNEAANGIDGGDQK